MLLYSGVQSSYSGRYSYLACGLAERIEGKDFSALEKKLSGNTGCFDNAWFGYLGYGLKDSLEKLTPETANWLQLPHLCMMRFGTIYQFDHEKRAVTCWSEKPSAQWPPARRKKDGYLPGVRALQPAMSKETYLKNAAEVIERIHSGDLYQANLTRKFIGSFSEAPDAFTLFSKLCSVSPAPYSAFLQLGDVQVLSSSPELFLQIDANGRIRARPIKGTAPRDSDPVRDRQAYESLAKSSKDQAENLMIVDLMRNDLSRSCVAGSVKAEKLFEVTSHTAVHHMASTISGQKRPDCSTVAAVKACFPPGSMTGAPKITAMKLCSRLEERERGVYSGAIGWFGGDGSCELSVVIRTLIVQDDRFEFQVGGGIVADSTPEGELKEIVDKSRGILAALGISSAFLEGCGHIPYGGIALSTSL